MPKEKTTELVPVPANISTQHAIPMKLDFAEIKKYIADKSFTDAEVESFIHVCEHNDLDPLKKEAHIARMGGKVTFLTGYIVYVKRAGLTGKLNGWSCIVDDEKNPTKATLTIHRKDWKEPFVWITYRSEVAFATAKGGSRYERASHKAMPCLMLRKCAISSGFPLAFADYDLGGLPYIPEEMEEADYTVLPTEESSSPDLSTSPGESEEKPEASVDSNNNSGFPENLPPSPEKFQTPEERKEAVRNLASGIGDIELPVSTEPDETQVDSLPVDNQAGQPTSEAQEGSEDATEPPAQNQGGIDRKFCAHFNGWLNQSDEMWKQECYKLFKITSRKQMNTERWAEYREFLINKLDPQQRLRYENSLGLYKMLKDLESADFVKEELELYLKVRFATSVLVPSNRDADIQSYVELLSRMAQTDNKSKAKESIKKSLLWVEQMGKNNVKALLHDLDVVRDSFPGTPETAADLITKFYKRMMIDPKGDNKKIYYLIDLTKTQFNGWAQTLISVAKSYNLSYFYSKGKTEPGSGAPDSSSQDNDDEILF